MGTPSGWRIAAIRFKRECSPQNHHLAILDNVAAETIVYPWEIMDPILHPNEGRHCEDVNIVQARIFLGSGCTTIDVAIWLLALVFWGINVRGRTCYVKSYQRRNSGRHRRAFGIWEYPHWLVHDAKPLR